MTDTGSEFKDILDLCIIYISKSDFLGEGKTVYHIDRIIRETGTIVENGFREIYVNAANKDGSDISKLMTIFTESNAYDDVLFPVTSKRKRYFKEDRKGVAEMCAIMDEIREEGRLEGRLEGKLELLEELGRIPEEARQKILSEINLEKLKKWHKTEEKAESIERFLNNMQL